MNIKKNIILLSLFIIPVLYSCSAPITITEPIEMIEDKQSNQTLAPVYTAIPTPIPTITASATPFPFPGDLTIKPTSKPLPSSSNINKTTLSGYLVEQTTGSPLPLIALKINANSAITDQSGYFYFPDLPSGSQTIYEYLNGLNNEPYTQIVNLSSGENKIKLTYEVNQPVPNIIATSLPIVTPAPTLTPNPTATTIAIPNNSTYKTRDSLIGIWEFTFSSIESSYSRKSIIAFRNSPKSSEVFYAAEILNEDEQDAKNGLVNYNYLSESNSDENSFMYGGYFNKQKQHFFMIYTYYNSPILQLGEYMSLIEPFAMSGKNTILGIEEKIINDSYAGKYNVVGKRLRDNFSVTDRDGGIFETYKASYPDEPPPTPTPTNNLYTSNWRESSLYTNQ